MKYKTAQWDIEQRTRFFVIPADKEIEGLLLGGRAISDEIVAQTPDIERADRIAEALNWYEANTVRAL